MASRMDRYHGTEAQTPKRSHRNVDLYDTLYDDTVEYSNVEGIARMEKTNEIDIRKIRDMLKEEEAKKRKRSTRPRLKRDIDLPKFESTISGGEDRNYDIRDILVKAKEEKKTEENDKYRDLKNTQYNILKKLKLDNEAQQEEYEKESKNMQDLVDTQARKSLSELEDSELSLDLFEDLGGDTTHALSKSSIRKLIEEEKEKLKEQEEPQERELDRSFYTSSLTFDDEDFQELRELSSTYHRNNIIIKILMAIIVIAGVIMLVLYFKK